MVVKSTSVNLHNARQNKEEDRLLMERFMEQKEEDLGCGCLLVIYRIEKREK